MADPKEGTDMRKLSTIVLAVLFIFTLPGIAQADEPDPVVTQVIWDQTGAENLPCPDGAHWRFDQGGAEIYNVSIHLDEVSGWGMDFDIADGYPRLFTVDTVFPLTTSTAVDYTYIGTGDAADHLVLVRCLTPPVTCPVELAELKARFATAQERVRVLEDAMTRALAVVRGNAASRVRAMREILRTALVTP